ncbi:MAG TPA: ATP synthase F1 subunit delta [Polyangia bacterium]|jgi:F-type H+-transporting ATPase subunit delta|nr:ATP synthase F1 subunit delta [Polyangia bacterium]
MAALGGSVARRYAKALFEIGVAEGNFEKLGQELADLAKAYGESAELRLVLENPVIKPSEKQAILNAVLPRVAPSPSVQRFARLLLERGRIGILRATARFYSNLADERAGQVRATVTSAAPLSPGELDRVRKALEARTGRKVLIQTAVDPSLIGGVVARVGDLVLDGSVRTQLDEMRQRLLN